MGIGLVLTGLTQGVKLWGQMITGAPTGGKVGLIKSDEKTTAEIPNVKEQAETLRKQLEALEREASRAQLYLSAVLVMAGLFTLAQGAFNYFSASSFKQQADDAINRIEKLADETERQYPILSTAEQVRRQLLRELRDRYNKLDWDEELYLQLDIHQRQRLFSVENVLGLEFRTATNPDDELARSMLSMGQLYASKFIIENRLHLNDFDRAFYYTHLACETTETERYKALNQLSVLLMAVKKQEGLEVREKDLKSAEEYIKQSIRQVSHQQRAWYNRGTIAIEKGDLLHAREYLEIASKEVIWETGEHVANASTIHYNLACAISIMLTKGLVPDKDKKNSEILAWESLERAARNGGARRKTFEVDCRTEVDPSGDLAYLGRLDTPRMKAVQLSFEQSWRQPKKAMSSNV